MLKEPKMWPYMPKCNGTPNPSKFFLATTLANWCEVLATLISQPQLMRAVGQFYPPVSRHPTNSLPQCTHNSWVLHDGWKNLFLNSTLNPHDLLIDSPGSNHNTITQLSINTQMSINTELSIKPKSGHKQSDASHSPEFHVLTAAWLMHFAVGTYWKWEKSIYSNSFTSRRNNSLEIRWI